MKVETMSASTAVGYAASGTDGNSCEDFKIPRSDYRCTILEKRRLCMRLTNNNACTVSTRQSSCLTRCSSDSLLESPKPTVLKQPKSDHTTAQVHLVNGHGGAGVTNGSYGKDAVGNKKCCSRPARKSSSRTGRRKKLNSVSDECHVGIMRKAEAQGNGVGTECCVSKERSSSVPVENYAQNNKGSTASKTTLMTDFFPVRRSSRTTSTQIKKRERQNLEEIVLSGVEEGLKVVHILGKGRGVVAKRPFDKGDYLVEYAGELVDLVTAKDREAKYSEDQRLGCYMYYFTYKDRGYCVDATAETSRFGRLINHSRLHPNCATKIIELSGQPRLIFVALRRLEVDEELLYDYGDRDRETLGSHPWLAF